MKAVILREKSGIVHLVDTDAHEKPKIEHGHQLLIKIRSAAINPIDLQMYEGKNEVSMLNSDILGRELSGIVEEVGVAVHNFKAGDEVFMLLGSMGSNGAFAEYVVVNEEIVVHKPRGIRHEVAASLPVAYATAWQTAERLDQPRDSSILILGASGSVGKALLNVLRHFGYNNFVGTAGSKYSRAQLEKFGLRKEKTVSYRHPEFQDELWRTNRQNLYDILIDCVGGDITEAGAKVLKREGIFVDITNLRTAEASYILFQKAAVLLNISRYVERELHYKYGHILSQVSMLIADEKWPLQDVQSMTGLEAEKIRESFKLLKENKTGGKKVVLNF